MELSNNPNYYESIMRKQLSRTYTLPDTLLGIKKGRYKMFLPLSSFQASWKDKRQQIAQEKMIHKNNS